MLIYNFQHFSTCRLSINKKLIHIFDGEYYWEIGKAGYPLKRIIDDIKNNSLEILRTYRVFETLYHRLFVLRKMGVSAYENFYRHQVDC